MILHTQRLLMRSPEEVTGADVCDYYTRNRDFLREYDPVREDGFYTAAFHGDLLRSQTADWESGKSRRFFLCRKEAPETVIGFASLNNIIRGAFQSCHLSYSLDGQQINQGLMTEAVKRLIDFAFEDLELHRIECNIMPRNKRSIAVAEKCGLTLEGISPKYLKINGIWEDHGHYVILNEQDCVPGKGV